MRGLLALAIGKRGHESIELFAGGIKCALFLFGEAAMDQWPFVVFDCRAQQRCSREFSKLWCFIDVTDDLAAEQPKVVTVHVARLA